MSNTDCGKLFVGGIPRDTTENALKDHFSRYGEVLSSTIVKDRMSEIPRGFGFVTFTDPSSADKALSDCHEILGKTVEVKKAIPRNEQPQFRQSHRESSISSTSTTGDNQFRTKKIFVGGLSANLTEEEFKGYFEKFGRISDVVVMYDNVTNRPRGFGFITFDSEDVVEEILKNSFHELGGKYVEVKRAVPKDSRRNVTNGESSRMGERASPYCYWEGNYWHGFYPSNEYTSPYGYNGMYNAQYHMAGYESAGFGMPMVAACNPWNGLQMARYAPLPYNCGPVYHMNSLYGAVTINAHNGIGNVRNGNLESDVRQSDLQMRESVVHKNKP